MNIQHQQARNLYFQTDMTQAHIAAIVGVSDQTVYRWIKQDNWKQMKEAAMHAPIAIVEMLYKQLYALNNSICKREEPVPTLQEAEINRKLINSIDKLKRQASLSENIQVLMGFTGFLNKIDNELAKTVVLHADHYLKEKKGHAPFGFYEEPEEQEQIAEKEPAMEPSLDQSVPQMVIKNESKPVAATKRTRPAGNRSKTHETQQQQTPEPPIQPQSLAAVEQTHAQKRPQLNTAVHNALPVKKEDARKIGKATNIHEQQLSPEQQKVKNGILTEWLRSLDKPNKSKHHW